MQGTSNSVGRNIFASILLTSVFDVHGLVAKPSNPTQLLGDETQVEIDDDISYGERPVSLLNLVDSHAEQSNSDIFDVVKSSFRRYWQKLTALFFSETRMYRSVHR
jgi:hypothetical protein